MNDIKRWDLFFFLLLCWSLPICAMGGRTTVAPGIWCSQHNLSALAPAQQEMLQNRLRRITGWEQLGFAENGRLEIRDFTAVQGGAVKARQVLLQAMQSGKQFIIENHSSSTALHFGQLDEGTKYADTRNGLELEIYRVRLDFADFEKMEALPAVRESFDEGFTFFHELLHGLGLKDTKIPNEIGECETVVNQMRKEIGLPLRDQYLADLLPITSAFRIIRLRFKAHTLDQNGQSRWKKQYLYFVSDFGAGVEPSVTNISLY